MHKFILIIKKYFYYFFKCTLRKKFMQTDFIYYKNKLIQVYIKF